MEINSTQKKKYFSSVCKMTFFSGFFFFFSCGNCTVISHHRFHQTNSLENFLEIPWTSPRALSWAETAEYKFHPCQVLLMTSNKLFVGDQSLARRLFPFVWKQEISPGGSVTLEFCPQTINVSTSIIIIKKKKVSYCVRIYSSLMATNNSDALLEVINLYGSMKELRSQLTMRRPLSPPGTLCESIKPNLVCRLSYINV